MGSYISGPYTVPIPYRDILRERRDNHLLRSNSLQKQKTTETYFTISLKGGEVNDYTIKIIF